MESIHHIEQNGDEGSPSKSSSGGDGGQLEWTEEVKGTSDQAETARVDDLSSC